MTDNIDHVANSREAIDNLRNWTGQGGEAHHRALQAICQAEATLALVATQKDANEQARIANVIAMATAEVLHDLRFSEDDRAAIDREGAR